MEKRKKKEREREKKRRRRGGGRRRRGTGRRWRWRIGRKKKKFGVSGVDVNFPSRVNISKEKEVCCNLGFSFSQPAARAARSRSF